MKRRPPPFGKLIAVAILGCYAIGFYVYDSWITPSQSTQQLSPKLKPIRSKAVDVSARAPSSSFDFAPSEFRSRVLLAEKVENVSFPQLGGVFRNLSFESKPVTDAGAGDTEVCDFAMKVANGSCLFGDGFIQYLEILYCTFSSSTRWIALLIDLLWLLVVFIGLASVADDFFCPCLSVMSNTLHLSLNVAGVTFLAFGNGAPDIFAAVISVTSGGDPSLAFGSLFGAGVFVTTVVAGSVAIANPFYAAERPLVRDIGFYLISIFLTFVVVFDGRFYFGEAIIYIVLYIVYVIVVIVSHMVFSRGAKTDKGLPLHWFEKSDEEETKADAELLYGHPPRERNGIPNQAYAGGSESAIVTPDREMPEDKRFQTSLRMTGYKSTGDLADIPARYDENANIESPSEERPRNMLSGSGILKKSGQADRHPSGGSTDPQRSITFGVSDTPGGGSVSGDIEMNPLSFSVSNVIREEDDDVFTDGSPQAMSPVSSRNASRRNDRAQLYKRSISSPALGDPEDGKFRRRPSALLQSVTRRLSKTSLRDKEGRLAASAWASSSSIAEGRDKLFMLRLRRPRTKKAIKDTLRVVENLVVSPLILSEGGAALNTPLMPRPSVPNFENYNTDLSYLELVEKERQQEEEEKEEEMEIFRGPWFKLLWHGLNPIDGENWKNLGVATKIYEIIKAPVLFSLLLTIPRVDENEPLQLWNRPLNCLHLVSSPVASSILFMMFGFTPVFEIGDFGFPLAVLLGLIGLIPAVLLFLFTQSDKRPRFHAGFAYFGFFAALAWIYALVTEVVNIIQAFGTFFNISNSLLGLTVLAWGNSIGGFFRYFIPDYIANLIMARQGFPRMSIAACYGAPLLNVLLGLGVPFIIKAAPPVGYIEVEMTMIILIMIVFLVISLISALTILPLRSFLFDKYHGFALIALYVVFLVTAILAERGVISDSLLGI